MKKTILFDLDGTLTDSQEGILKSIKFALEHFGYDVPDEKTLQLFLGPPLVDAFQEHCGMTFDQAEETYFNSANDMVQSANLKIKCIRIL